MRHLAQSLHSSENPLLRTFHPTSGVAVAIMWGVTALWVIIGSLSPVITRNATASLDVTLLLMGPTCCMHIGWIITSRIDTLRIKNGAQLDHQLSIEMAFAAGQMTERQLRKQNDDHVQDNVIDLDQKRRPTPPTSPEGWRPSREYGSSLGS